MEGDWIVQRELSLSAQDESISATSRQFPRDTYIHDEAMAHIEEQQYSTTESDDEGRMEEISDADAQSMMEPAISLVATRLTSPDAPAAEKAAAMDDMEGGGYFESDGEITPPAMSSSLKLPKIPDYPCNPPLHLRNTPRNDPGLPLDALQTQYSQDLAFPSPRVVGPKPLIIETPDHGRSASKEVLADIRSRSTSWSSDAFKKFLPSLPKPGNLMPRSSSFTSGSNQKVRNRGFSMYRYQVLGSSSPTAGEALRPLPQAVKSDEDANISNNGTATPRSSLIRRVSSDESLLYHTLSRASSLGDDTRFENQHEMVNSRGKAIRDSLQDRSTFKLPAMPSMPRVPNFSRSLNFAFSLSNGTGTVKWKGDVNSVEDILPGNMKRRSAVPNPSAVSNMIDTHVPKPEAIKLALPDVEEGEAYLDRAMVDLTGDVVIMGGYRGSILRSTKSNQQLWAPIKVGLNIRKVNMEVGLNPEDEENMEKIIYPSGMLKHVGPIDISRRLFKNLRLCENAKDGKLRIWDYGYDWRLSPHILSKKLTRFMQKLPSNQGDGPKKGALVIAHSLGGLIARHAANHSPELFSGVVYAGVPQSCVNILGPLRNGDAVLLSSRVLTAQVNFTIRTSFAFLPLDGYCFVDKNRKDDYKIDFFDAEDWIKYRLSPCTDPPLPSKRQPTGSLANILNGSLTNLTLPRKMSLNASSRNKLSGNLSVTDRLPSIPIPIKASNAVHDAKISDRTLAPQMGNVDNPVSRGRSTSTSISTAVTLPRADAIAYLRRTLADTKRFKLELRHDAALGATGRYPPMAVIYGKSVPTVYAARVDGRDGIACTDSYDDLAFASGDGVCLAKEAMLPKGYSCVRGGQISSDRGHVTLLGDLNAVGRAILAVQRGRAKGIGLVSV